MFSLTNPPRFGFETGFASGNGGTQITGPMNTRWGSSKWTIRNIAAGWNSLNENGAFPPLCCCNDHGARLTLTRLHAKEYHRHHLLTSILNHFVYCCYVSSRNSVRSTMLTLYFRKLRVDRTR